MQRFLCVKQSITIEQTSNFMAVWKKIFLDFTSIIYSSYRRKCKGTHENHISEISRKFNLSTKNRIYDFDVLYRVRVSLREQLIHAAIFVCQTVYNY